MSNKWRRLLAQKTTWLGLSGLIVMLIQAAGVEIDDGAREAITETLLVISALVLVLIEPKDDPNTMKEPDHGITNHPGGGAGDTGRLDRPPAPQSRQGQGEQGSGGRTH